MRALKLHLLTAFAAVSLAAGTAFGGAIVPGFTSGGELLLSDDTSTPKLDLGFTINFFGLSRDTVYVNNNGNLTFNGPYSAYSPIAPLSDPDRGPIIAPFFGDVDTTVHTAPDPGFPDDRSKDTVFPSNDLKYGWGTFAGHNAFGATWDGVGYWGATDGKLNSFQVLLVDRSDVLAGDFDIYFNYDSIQWEAGGASLGENGLGGYSARVGYSNGTTEHTLELAGSGVNGALLDTNVSGLIYGSNVGVAGRYLFEVRNIPDPTPPSTSVPDGASTLDLLGLAFAGLAAFRRRR